MIAVEELLKPVSPEQPCGEDFTYNASLSKLETLVQGKPEVEMGDYKVPAEEPNWKELRDLSVELLKQSKHLRAVVIFCLANLRIDGLAGFRDGLAVLSGLLQQYWEGVYPKLDVEDNNDPTERVNILNDLSAPAGTATYQFVRFLQQAPLCNSVSMGRFGLADIQASQSPPAESLPEGKPVPTTAQIEAAFRDSDQGQLRETYDVVCQANTMVTELGTYLDNTVGAGGGPNWDNISRTLKEIQNAFGPYLEGAGAADEAGEAGAETGGGAARSAGGGGGVRKNIESTADVVAALDAICKYYRQYEPSSPIPLILERARRLVDKDFMSIMSDLTPEALSQLKVITGAGETADNPA